MSDQAPLVPAPGPGPASRVVLWSAGMLVRASLVISPRPAALVVRKVFASAGAKTAAGLARHAPPDRDVVLLADQRYGPEVDMLVDIVRPAAASGPLPLVVWVHGGGWVGGAKEELARYFKLIASHGYAVAGPRYCLAPEHHYPAPARQVMAALGYLRANAAGLQIDPDRVAIAGDSAGAQIAAQLGALVTTPGYAQAVGITPAITKTQLRGLVLACGLYDLALARQASSPAGRAFITAILRAYAGTRSFSADPAFATWSVAGHLSPAFPPALITVGNADPLRPHSELLVAKLRARGTEVDTVFWPASQQPPLGREYQFDLDTGPAQHFLDCLLTFLRHRLAAPPPLAAGPLTP